MRPHDPLCLSVGVSIFSLVGRHCFFFRHFTSFQVFFSFCLSVLTTARDLEMLALFFGNRRHNSEICEIDGARIQLTTQMAESLFLRDCMSQIQRNKLHCVMVTIPLFPDNLFCTLICLQLGNKKIISKKEKLLEMWWCGKIQFKPAKFDILAWILFNS